MRLRVRLRVRVCVFEQRCARLPSCHEQHSHLICQTHNAANHKDSIAPFDSMAQDVSLGLDTSVNNTTTNTTNDDENNNMDERDQTTVDLKDSDSTNTDDTINSSSVNVTVLHNPRQADTDDEDHEENDNTGQYDDECDTPTFSTPLGALTPQAKSKTQTPSESMSATPSTSTVMCSLATVAAVSFSPKLSSTPTATKTASGFIVEDSPRTGSPSSTTTSKGNDKENVLASPISQLLSEQASPKADQVQGEKQQQEEQAQKPKLRNLKTSWGSSSSSSSSATATNKSASTKSKTTSKGANTLAKKFQAKASKPIRFVAMMSCATQKRCRRAIACRCACVLVFGHGQRRVCVCVCVCEFV